MTPKERAEYLIEEFGKDEAIRQCLEDLGNSDNHIQEGYWRAVLEILRNS